MQPGQLVTPGNDDQAPSQEQPVAGPQPVGGQQVETPPPSTPVEPAPFTVDGDDLTPAAGYDPAELSWTASEFIEHQKPQGWYLTLTAAALVVAAVMYLVLKDIVTTIVIVVAAAMFGVVGARKPRPMTYTLSRRGLRIGDKAYPYSSFKSFSVIEEDAIDSIQFLPLKRLMPPISIYFPPEQEEEIVSLLADYLPHEDRDHDAIDRLMKRMHF